MTSPNLMAQIALPFWSAIQIWSQVVIGQVINSLPEGLLTAFFAWAVLRVLPKQNSRTRFAVWFVALLSVVGIACAGGQTLSRLNDRIFGASSLNFSLAHPIDLPAHWAVYLFIVWLVGATIAVTRVALSMRHLRHLRQSCISVNAADLDPSVRHVLDKLNSAKTFWSRPATLATSTSVSVPAALGIWKPVIVLPAWALRELSPSDMAIVIRHEFAHLQRWDDWTNLLQKFMRALFFFHPAVWWIENRLSVEREMACDDIVVAQTDNPLGYAACLVSLLEKSLAQRRWTMAQAIVHRAREASDRLAQILDRNRAAGTNISKPALVLVGAFAVLCVAMLPQTPQFVAFEHPLLPVANHEYSAALAQPVVIPPAVIIPASFKIDRAKIDRTTSDHAPLGRTMAPKVKTAPSQITVQPDITPIQSELARMSETQPFIQVSASQGYHPTMRALVFVETVQFMPADDESSDPTFALAAINSATNNTAPALMWRVQVWQVTFVTPMGQQSARIPVANKI